MPSDGLNLRAMRTICASDHILKTLQIRESRTKAKLYSLTAWKPSIKRAKSSEQNPSTTMNPFLLLYSGGSGSVWAFSTAQQSSWQREYSRRGRMAE